MNNSGRSGKNCQRVQTAFQVILNPLSTTDPSEWKTTVALSCDSCEVAEWLLIGPAGDPGRKAGAAGLCQEGATVAVIHLGDRIDGGQWSCTWR